ncbi:hypothetical protein F4802DRAFT_604167 [Xylaria palmicola]|nr:hypothetical protein F4802DRAFT_604167 [Xylaria palmicola]
MSSGGGGSRQRNCNACVRGKRRCDKGQPACGRCVKQRYVCVYGGRRLADGAHAGSSNAAFDVDSVADPTPDPVAFVPDFDMLPAFLGANLSLVPDAPLLLTPDFGATFGAMPGNSGLLADSWLTNMSGIPQEKSLVRKDYSKMVPECDSYAPWQLADPSTKAAFGLGVIKKSHATFAQTGGTVYVHRHLYKDNMPRVMLQAFTVCSLYAGQTASNRAVVLRVLHGSVEDLKATVGGGVLTPQEKMARVHALMFYQTIRMFDGDVTLGQQAEDDMALLVAWNKELLKISDNLDDLANKGAAASEHPPESWERWVFAESLRRTLIMCCTIQKYWGMLKLRLKASDVGYWEFAHRWTLSRIYMLICRSHLWNAQNSFDFFRAWREKPLYVISEFNFDEFLKTGTGDDLDDFGYFLLSLHFGVSEIKTFCYETSGRLTTLA